MCDCLKFIISGNVRSEYINEKVKIKLFETITAPNNIASNCLMGNNNYSVSVYACCDNTGVLVIDKQDFISIMQEHRVVLLNYLIDLSRKSQTPFEAYNQIASDNIRAKVTTLQRLLLRLNYEIFTCSLECKDRCLILC